MFNGFPSTTTPSVKVWNYATAQANTLANPAAQIALTDDCAPLQIVYVGGSYYPVAITLPNSPPAGKMITIKVDNIGAIQSTGNGVFVYDSSVPSAYSTAAPQLVAKIGCPAYVTFVYVPQQQQAPSATRYATSCWFVYGSINSSISSGPYENNYTVNLGDNNSASGFSSVAIGSSNYSTSTNSVALGTNNYATGLASVALGGYGTADGYYSTTLAGIYATTKGIYAGLAQAGDALSIALALGGIQKFSVVLGVKTTDATATVLRSNTSAATTTNQYILRNNSASVFKGTVIAAVTGGGNTAGWTFEGVIKRGANAASTTVVQSVVNLVGQDSGASGWTIAIAADTTNGGLKVTVTGQAATTITWTCLIDGTEASY